MVPFVPAKLLVRDRFLSLDKAPSIAMPVLVVHGTDDEVIPYRLGERLSKAFPHATLRTVPGGHHNDLFGADAGLWPALIAFARGG